MNYLNTLRVLVATWESREYPLIVKLDFSFWLLKHADFWMTPAEMLETLEQIKLELVKK